jgi:5-hydroxyisourate hydrolase-like protein (transthyretin family)
VGGSRPIVLALIAYATLMCASLGPLSPPLAAASTSIVRTLPSASRPELVGASTNGRYFAYADEGSPGTGELQLHWYDQETGADVVVGNVSNADIGRISADGRHIVFQSWGNDPLGGGLVEGTVYEATIDENDAVSYTQVSPTAKSYPGGGLEAQYGHATASSDGSIVSYEENNKANFVWSRSTGISTQLEALGGTPAVLSPDGSTVAADAGAGITEYSASDGSVIRAISTANAPNVYELSANGSYGVGISGGTPEETGYAYVNFVTGRVQVIPNTFDGQCGGGYYSSIATSADGQVVAFGSLSSELVPDPSGGSLGYYSYEPTTEQVVNQSGTFAGIPPSGDCPSVAITGDGQTMFFVSYSTPSTNVGWISGTVTDSEGKPLSGVSVKVFEAGGSSRTLVTSNTTNLAGKYTVELASGSYKVEFSASSEVGNYAPQYYNAKPALAEAEAVSVTAGANTSEINAQMQPGGQITGTVTDNEGKPLADVSVKVFEAGGSKTVPVLYAQTGLTGNYTVSNLASGSYKVEFSESSEAGNYAPQYYNAKFTWAEAGLVSVTAGITTPEINAQMQPGGQITGTVTDSEGKALSGVSVKVFEAGGSNTIPAITTMTGSGGSYTVSNLASGSYKVEFSANSEIGNYAPQYYNAKSTLAEAEAVSVTAGANTSEINAQMQLGGQITGTVTDSEGKALSGVDVGLFEAGGSSTVPLRYTQTGSTGKYTVEDLGSGSYKVGFSANSEIGNYAPQYYNAKSTLAEAEAVSVTAGANTSEINAALAKGTSSFAVIRGTAAGRAARRDFAQATTKTEGHAYIYKGTFAPATLPPAPVNSSAPGISGEAREGVALAESHGSWTNHPTGYAYQWRDCDSSGGNCSDIAGATSQTYTLSASDVGHTIRVQESATNAGGTGGPVASAPTMLVTAPATGGGFTGTAGGGSTGTGGGSTGASGLTGWGSTLGTGAGGMPSNAFTLGGSQPGSNGSLLVSADVPGPGTLTAQQAAGARQASIAAKRQKRKGRAQPKLIQPTSVTATKAGAVTLTLKPTAAALKLLRGHRSVKVSVRITFTPTGGTPSNHTIQVTFKAPKGKHGH